LLFHELMEIISIEWNQRIASSVSPRTIRGSYDPIVSECMFWTRIEFEDSHSACGRADLLD
jgi:hypothetical protein